MKKKILAIAVALFGTFGMIASAQMPDKSYKPQKFTDYAFEGVLLELDQQAKIDSLNAATFNNNKDCPMQAAQCQQKACAKDQCVAGKCQKVDSVSCDTAQCTKQRGRHHGMRPGQGHKVGNVIGFRPSREYVAAVKDILTPEQYVTFLENIVTMPMPEPGQVMPGMMPGHGQKMGPRVGQGHNQGKAKDKGQAKDKSKDKSKSKDKNKDKNKSKSK